MSDSTTHRRTFLRGLGTALALPALSSLLPRGARAAAAAKPPQRMAFLYVPNGVHMEDWTPTAEGAGFALPYILEPLAPLQDKLTVLSGLTHDKARANGDGPGDHARAAAAVLTGSQPYKTDGADIRVGVSVDQLAAQQLGEATRFRSLELGIDRSAQAGNCDSGYSCAYSSNISWSSPSQPVMKETNPRLVFERLFGAGTAGERTAAQQQRDHDRRSVLDFVLEDANQLQGRLSGDDRAKLDEYFSSVREIERRLLAAELGGAAEIPGAERPAGRPNEFSEHVKLMADMLALSFQADETRIATFMFANEGSNRAYNEIGVAEGHHNISHHQGDPAKQEQIRDINRFHVTLLGHLLTKLDSVREPDGSTLLDNSLICYCSAIGDGNRHNHDDLPVLLAGSAGGALATGRHLVYPKNTPMCNLFLAMLDVMGVHVDSFGDSSGFLNGVTV